MSTLITFLGKGQAQDGGYRKACYHFADGQKRETSYFGLALADVENAATVRILGTSGSMWDALILERGDTHGRDDVWDELAAAVAADRVDQALLDAVERMLNHSDQRKFQLRLIPYGVKDNEQVAILLAITSDLPTDQGIILDVTHALRHLPMLGLLSVFYLRAATKIRIDAIYYGALEQTQNNQTPVLRLDGLLKLYEWIRALENFNKDGDYGAFQSLFNNEQLPGDLLAEAAFLERVANASLGSQKLNTAMQKIDADAAMSAAGKLFLPLLNQRTEWRKGKDRAQRERRLAIDYLGRADYLRAAQFGYESFISAQTRGDLNEYEARNEADAYLSEKAKALTIEAPENFSTLKNLRNALAHGTMDSNRGKTAAFIKKLTGDESELRKWLEKALRQP